MNSLRLYKEGAANSGFIRLFPQPPADLAQGEKFIRGQRVNLAGGLRQEAGAGRMLQVFQRNQSVFQGPSHGQAAMVAEQNAVRFLEEVADAERQFLRDGRAEGRGGHAAQPDQRLRDQIHREGNLGGGQGPIGIYLLPG
jgi:hypothetical protein